MKRDATDREQGLLAAVRRFPHAELTIRRLMNRSEAFCDICEELGDTEYAMAKVEEMSGELRQARIAEWAQLLQRLVDEIEAELRESEAWRLRVHR